jgi:hypothetical protein
MIYLLPFPRVKQKSSKLSFGVPLNPLPIEEEGEGGGVL